MTKNWLDFGDFEIAFYLEAVKLLTVVPPKFDFNAETQNFIEYF